MAAGLPIAVLISGRGSNMLAIADAVSAGTIAGHLALVLSDRPQAAGLASAAARGLATAVVDPADHPDRAAWNRALGRRLADSGAGLAVLAGFMRILDRELVSAWQGRMLNVHPSLLPRYPGLHTHRRALAAGDTEHGCTIHFVTPELDAGPAILQGRLRVRAGEDEAALSARVQRLEHRLYPRAVAWFAAGRLALADGRAWLDGRALDGPVTEDEA